MDFQITNIYLKYGKIVPHNDAPNSSARRRAKGEFGTNWFATFGPIQRYILGFEVELINELLAYLEQVHAKPFQPDELENINRIIQKYQYQIPYGAMPMKEGVDHVKFLVELVINHHRYAMGAPIVGGEESIGMVTYRGEKFQVLNNKVGEIRSKESLY